MKHIQATLYLTLNIVIVKYFPCIWAVSSSVFHWVVDVFMQIVDVLLLILLNVLMQIVEVLLLILLNVFM